jgi:hypothetical protein
MHVAVLSKKSVIVGDSWTGFFLMVVQRLVEKHLNGVEQPTQDKRFTSIISVNIFDNVKLPTSILL